jgi:hypothetical protein
VTSALCWPVLDREGSLVAVVLVVDRKGEEGSRQAVPFTREDERIMVGAERC